MVDVAFVSRAGDDQKRPEESKCIGANDEKNGPSDDLSACVENKRLLFGCLHLSRGDVVDSADPNRSSAGDYCRSFSMVIERAYWPAHCSTYWPILTSISQVFRKHLASSTLQVLGRFSCNCFHRFPKISQRFQYIDISSTCVYLSTSENDAKAPNRIIQNIGIPVPRANSFLPILKYFAQFLDHR